MLKATRYQFHSLLGFCVLSFAGFKATKYSEGIATDSDFCIDGDMGIDKAWRKKGRNVEY